MPRLPTSGDYANAIPQDRTGVAGVGISPVGAAISGLGQALDRELIRIDTLKAEDAYNKAAQLKAELSYGEEGYEKIKGGNALERPVSDEYTARFKQGLEGIANGLKSPRQKALFNRMSGGLAVDFGVGIQRHLMTEADAFNRQVKAGALAVETDNIIRNWDNPQAQARSFERLKGLRDRSLADGDAADFVEAQYRDSLSKAHLGVVHAAIDNKNFDYAKGWLATHKDAIDAASVEKAESIVVAQEREVQAMDAGRAASGLGLLAGDAALVKRFGKDPEMLKAARSEMRDQYALQRASQVGAVNSLLAEGRAYIEAGGDINSWPVDKRVAASEHMKALRSYQASMRRGEDVAPTAETAREKYDLTDRMLAGDQDALDFPVESKLGQWPISWVDEARKIQQDAKSTEADVKLATLRNNNGVLSGVVARAKIDKAKVPSTLAGLKSILSPLMEADAAAGKPWDQQRLEKEARSLLQKVVVGEMHYPWGPRIPLTQRIKRRSDITMDDVPPAEAKRIELSLRLDGLPVTEAAIIGRWAESLEPTD